MLFGLNGTTATSLANTSTKEQHTQDRQLQASIAGQTAGVRVGRLPQRLTEE